MIGKVLALAFALITFSASACLAGSADVKSGNDWYRLCTSPEESISSGVCRLYIQAFVGGAITMWVVSPNAKQRFCLPDGATLDQLRLVVVKFMDKKPEMLHEPFDLLVYLALATSFPCPTVTTGSVKPK